jgi:AAA domain/Bifunctional DNA primase/polymerase, N-terminal
VTIDLINTPAVDPYADTAAAYVAKGWTSPLPLPAREKNDPPVGFTGWRNSRWATAADIDAWLEQARGTGANIGNRAPRGVAGIDYDAYRDPAKVRPGHSFADRVAAWGELPPTWASTSRTDGSMIRWYRVPEDIALPGDAGDDVEIIHANYRYAVAPPSVHPDGRIYRWLTPDGEVTDEIPHVDDLAELPAAWVEGLAGLAHARVTDADVEEFLAGVPDGDYDDDLQRLLDEFDRRLNAEDGWGRFADCANSQAAMLRVTMELALAGACGAPGVPVALAAAEDLFVTYRVASGETVRDAAGAWRRGLAGAVGYVRDNGVAPIPPFKVPADILGARRRSVAKPRPRLRDLILRRDDLDRLPKPEPLIEDTLDRRTVALLAGYHGTYKSFTALAWAASVATGTPWMGRPVQQGKVLYIVGEGATGIDHRLGAWEEYHGARIASDDLHVLPVAIQLADQRALAEVVDYVEAVGFALVIIDTVARAAVGLEENSAKDMGVFIEAAEQIKRATEPGAVLLVHHTGKDKSTVRGSSALEAAMDTVYTTEGGDGLIKLKRTKRKDGPMEDTHLLRFEPVAASGVLVSTKPTETPAVELDRRAGAFRVLHQTFGHIGSFAGTRGEETLRDSLGIGRTAARDRIAELARDNFLRVESVGRSHVYHLQTDAAVKRWGTVVLHTEDRKERCAVNADTAERAPAPGTIVREDDGTTYVVESDGSRREATEDEVQAVARAAVQRLRES